MREKNNAYLIIAALLLLLAAGGLFLVNRDSNPVDPKGRISGVVMDAETGFPLQDVEVTAVDEDGYKVSDHGSSDLSEEDGVFSLELPAGKYTLCFDAENHISLKSTAKYTVEADKNTEIEEPFRLAAEKAQTVGQEGGLIDSGDSSENTGMPDNSPAIEAAAGSEEDSGASAAAPKTVFYTIQCIDENGSELKRSVLEGKPGTTMTLYAPSINGYYSLTDELSVTLTENEADNLYIFVYESIEDDSYSDLIPMEAVSYNGHSYYAFHTAAEYSFWEAEEYAESVGGYLAIISDSAENEFLYDYVFRQKGLRSAYFGLTDEDSEEEWYWVDGSPVSYNHWGPGQPDDHNGEDYALFYYKDSPYDWNDGDFGPDSLDGTVTFLIEWDWTH